MSRWFARMDGAKRPNAVRPSTARARRLDYELELSASGSAVRETRLGATVPIDEAASHIAGYCLLNDWSARDLQAWEYQPLGPFLAKNFLTSVSPWVVSPLALAPFRKAMPNRPHGDAKPLSYLSDPADRQNGGLAIQLEVTLSTEKMRAAGLAPHILSRGSADAAMYWSAAQIVAHHHDSNGCNLQPGDLIGTGTLSTDSASGLGSLLEISQGEKQPTSLRPAKRALSLSKPSRSRSRRGAKARAPSASASAGAWAGWSRQPRPRLSVISLVTP